MIDTLTKFDQLTIDTLKKEQQHNSFSEKDIEFCKSFQKHLDDSIDFLKAKESFFDNFLELSNSGLRVFNFYDEIESISDTYKQLRKSFISKIVEYLNKEYGVSLSSYTIIDTFKDRCNCENSYSESEKKEIKEKYYRYIFRDMHFNKLCECKIDYKIVLNEILKQMKGSTFKDIKIKELKESVSKDLRFNNHSLKNKTLSFQNVYITDGWSYTSINRYSLSSIFEALYHFETNDFGLSYKMEWYINHFSSSSYHNRVDCYAAMDDFDSNVIEKVKLFKNNRFDIKFKSHESAKEFLNNYIIKN